MTYPSLLAELEGAIKTGTQEYRVETLRRLTNLFLGTADQLTEQQIGVFDDVLVHLVQRIESKALIQLSESLAPVGNAPIEVIRQLSRHDTISIAGPVLTQSSRLADSDLVDVAKVKGQAHLLAISGRTLLSTAVTDVLVERGDTKVHHALAKNAGAQFSELGFSALVKKSAGDEKLTERLGLRLDIPLALLRQLLARASDIVRSRLLASSPPEHKEQIQRALASIADEVGHEATKPRDLVRAENIVFELNRRAKLSEMVLLEFVHERKYEEMIATLALFCGVKSDLIEQLLQNVGHDGVIMVCKAAKLHWPTAALILQKRFPQHSPSEQELQAAKVAFLELSRESALRAIRFLQVQNAAKKA